MRKIGIILVVFVALVCGAAASVLAYNYLKNKPVAEGPVLVSVVVAAKDLTFGEELTTDNMQIVMYPEASVPSGAYHEVDSLLGEVTKVFLKKNEPILESKLSSIGGGLSLLIDKDKRAASIQVDKVSGVSGFVLPGDKVDVIATFSNYGKNRESVAKTILQRLDVLAAGEKTEQKGDKVITSQSVTLLVDPDGAQALALASQEGKLHLALRNPTDDDTTSIDVISKKAMLSSTKSDEPKVIYRYRDRPQEPAREEPKKPDSVKIIRGKKVDTQAPVIKQEEPGT